MLINILTVIYLIVAIILVSFILMQQGKGADAGASFGAGAAGTVFGAAGSANFLSRTTAVLAIIFFGVSLIIGNLNSNQSAPKSQFEDLTQAAEMQQKQNQQVPNDKLENQSNEIPQ